MPTVGVEPTVAVGAIMCDGFEVGTTKFSADCGAA
jgi:hypothetical protein